MARSKETFSKKEIEKKKVQKRKEKAQRREERKSSEGKSFEDMLAYTDEYGNILSSPPDPAKRKAVKKEDMVIGARNSGDDEEEVDPVRNGKVTFFNTSKGYGFIRDLKTNESIFVHSNGLMTNIMENDKVSFETERGPRGLNAIKVTVIE
ncbi:MAG: cold shock domain-containing protein [Cyclobacteriaceae bacterium]|nr:cold shock domain-containing protein [Cyclobacteriaceae bacterium]